MIRKKDIEELSEIQCALKEEIAFLEELFDEAEDVLQNPKAFKRKNLSQYLQNMLISKENNFLAFTKQLAQLSKNYGIAIKSVGGVQIGEIKEIEYSDDETSGDLYPKVITWAD